MHGVWARGAPGAFPYTPVMDARGTGRPSLLVFERGMLRSRRRRPIHGVELFRLKFLRDAISLGVEVTLVLERSWEAHLPAYLGGRTPRLIRVPYVLSKGVTGLLAALMCRRTEADTLLIGAPDESVAACVDLLLRTNRSHRVVISAEGECGPRLQRALRRRPVTVVANSRYITDNWRGKFRGDLHESYGLADAHQFHPPQEAPRKQTVDFVLLAKLPSDAKGADIALEAFALLPGPIRERCRLHLAGYVDPPPSPAPGVVTHRWLAADAVGPFLRTMDVQLVPSRWESFCQSAVQGMLTGLPLITSDISVLTDKLDTGGGIACRTAPEYAAAMERLALDADLRRTMGEAGRAAALERYVYDPAGYLSRFFLPGRSFGAGAGAGAETLGAGVGGG